MIYDSIQLLEGSKIVNATAESGTSFPVSPVEGQLFFRSDTSKMHIYNGTSWAEVARAASAASLVPRISSVDVTNSSYIPIGESYVNTAGGYIKISGSAFASGCSVLIDLAPATAVTFVGPEELRVQVPAKSAGNYSLFVVNPDGGTAIFIPGISYDPVPVWSTAASLGSSYYKGIPISVQLAATENATITYTLGSGSSLPPGITLSSSGLISGTVTTLSSTTTYAFDVVATDNENQSTTRTFSMTVVFGVPVEYLIVGGGGGGGTDRKGSSSLVGGGGGGGGVVIGSTVLTSSSNTITVGSGGAGGDPYPGSMNLITAAHDGKAGGVSKINSITAYGGGGGSGGFGSAAPAGTYGGGGGGAGRVTLTTGTLASAGTQGFSGANGSSNIAGGGGGAGGAPVERSGWPGYFVNGGAGTQWAANETFYGGGGGGAATTTTYPPTVTGFGGSGGGASYNNSASNNTGGGGGGGGGSGGSGVVIIRYPGTQKLAHVNGGSVSVSGGYVYHTFTSSGTFIVS